MVDGLQRKGAPNLDLLPEGRGILLVEFGADDPNEARHRAMQLIDRLKHVSEAPSARLYSLSEARKVWQIREAGPRAAAFAPGAAAGGGGWDDAAVDADMVGHDV